MFSNCSLFSVGVGVGSLGVGVGVGVLFSQLLARTEQLQTAYDAKHFYLCLSHMDYQCNRLLSHR